MTDTVEALAYKADVKTRTKDRLQETGRRIAEAADHAVGSVRGSASSTGSGVSGGMERMSGMAATQAEHVRSGVRQGAGIAKDNPLGLAIGAAAAGFLIGMALPSTSIEDEKLGEQADAVKRAAGDVGREALERGKTVAQEATKAGLDAARSAGQQQADELTSSAKERTDELTSG